MSAIGQKRARDRGKHEIGYRISKEGQSPLKTSLKPLRAKENRLISGDFQVYKGLYLQLYIQSMYSKYVHHFLTKVVNNVCLSARIPPRKNRSLSLPTHPFFLTTARLRVQLLSSLHQKEVGRELSLLLQFARRPNGTLAHWQKRTPTFSGGDLFLAPLCGALF